MEFIIIIIIIYYYYYYCYYYYYHYFTVWKYALTTLKISLLYCSFPFGIAPSVYSQRIISSKPVTDLQASSCITHLVLVSQVCPHL